MFKTILNNLAQDEIGQINWQSIYDQNSKPTNTGFGLVYPINTTYSDNLYYSTNYLVKAIITTDGTDCFLPIQL